MKQTLLEDEKDNDNDFIPSAEDLAMIDRYYEQMEKGQLQASDIVPDFKLWEEELGITKASEREAELDEIRGEKGEEKELAQGPER